MNYCPRCASALVTEPRAGRDRKVCPDAGCGFVWWNNPLPVVAAIVEHEGAVILARNHGWPDKMYGLVTGFLEQGESPEDGVVREVHEELGLDATVESLVGVYPFVQRNELIVAYHLTGTGAIVLGEELAGIKRVAPEKLRPWPFGTGLAVADWLARIGHAREA